MEMSLSSEQWAETDTGEMMVDSSIQELDVFEMAQVGGGNMYWQMM